jgi:hypothetical protein
VHLFGPNSIMSNVAPDLPGETAKPATAPSTGGQPQPAAQATAAASAGAPQAGDANDPTLGAVLHQMFVVGDPDHPNLPAPGRAAERPGATN